MSAATTDLALTYESVDCPACGFVFMVPDTLLGRRRKDGKTFFCPAGGCRMDYGETEAQKLQAQLDRTQRQLATSQSTLTHERDQRTAAENALRAQRGANTRLRKRVSNGVCPCCSRTFADVARHMAGQHPDFVEQEK